MSEFIGVIIVVALCVSYFGAIVCSTKSWPR